MLTFRLYGSRANFFRPNLLCLWGICFLSVVLVQIIAGGNAVGDFATYAKFLEFFIIIPFVIASSPLDLNEGGISKESIARAIRNGGVALMFIAIYARHNTSGADLNEVVARLNFFGSYMQKNSVGALLLFSTGASFYLALRGSKIDAIWTLALISCVAYIGARSSSIAQLLVISWIYLSYRGAGKLLIAASSVFFIIIFSFPLLALVSKFPWLMARFTEALSLDTSTVTSSSSRILLWTYAIDGIKSSPLFGHGWATYSWQGSVVWLQNKTEPHNVILQILYSGGIVNLFAFTAAIVSSIFSGFRSGNGYLVILAIAYLVNGLVGPTFGRFDGHLFMLLISAAVFFRKSESS